MREREASFSEKLQRNRNKKLLPVINNVVNKHAAKQISADLSELDIIFTLKENTKTSLKAFLGKQHCSALVQTGLGKSTIRQR